MNKRAKSIIKNAKIILFMVLINSAYIISCGNSNNLQDELLDEISKYKIENGYLPKCKDSKELINTLGLNGNEIYPEYFEYQYYNEDDYYILKIILHHESNNLIIDSRK